jgi:hypothetical protein
MNNPFKLISDKFDELIASLTGNEVEKHYPDNYPGKNIVDKLAEYGEAAKEYVDEHGGGSGVLFSTTETLDATIGGQNVVDISSLTPTDPTPKTGDQIVDSAGTYAQISAVTDTTVTATTKSAPSGAVDSVDGMTGAVSLINKYLQMVSGKSNFFNETDGGGLVYLDDAGREVAGIALNGNDNCPQLYVHRYTGASTTPTTRVLFEIHEDGAYVSTALVGTNWVRLGPIHQPAYTDMPLQTLMDASSALDTAAYFACNASSVWKFADVTAQFEVHTLDGASRLVGDGTSVKVYYESTQYGEITENGGTYEFAGPVLFRGLDGYSGDISGITVTQDAIMSGLEDEAATIANAVGWIQRQLDAISSSTQDHVRGVSLGGAAYTLPNEAGHVNIPRASAAIMTIDPNDYGTVPTVNDLPVVPQSNHERYIGVTSGGSQDPQATKFAPAFDSTVAVEVVDPHCVAKDTEVNSNWVFDSIRLTKNPATTAMRDAWQVLSGWNNEDKPLVYLQRAEVISGVDYDTVAVMGALKKNLSFRFTTNYAGDIPIYNNAGAYIGVDSTLDLSQEFGWQVGDTMHYDDASGEMWVTDADGNRVTLRVAVVFSNTTPITNWSFTLSWLHYIGLSFWKDNVGAYVWQDQGEVYATGSQVQGEDIRGYLHPSDFKNFSDKYTKAEIDAMFAALANQ